MDLREAAARGDAETVARLLSETDAHPDGDAWESPLYAACACESAAVVRLLLRAGAAPDPHAVDRVCRLHTAPVLAEFLRAGLGVDAGIGFDRRTPLHVACAAGNAGAVKLLLRCGARVNLETADGETPLALALNARHFAVAALVAEAGGVAGAVDPRAGELAMGRMETSAVPVALLLLGDGSAACAETIRRLASALHETFVFSAEDSRRVRLRCLCGEETSELAPNDEELAVAVVVASGTCVASLDASVKQWRSRISSAGIRCSALAAGVEFHDSSLFEARQVSARHGLPFVSLDGTDSTERLVSVSLRLALEGRFYPGKAFRRAQFFALALGLHPRLGADSPVLFLDSFVLGDIASLAQVPFFFEVQAESDIQ